MQKNHLPANLIYLFNELQQTNPSSTLLFAEKIFYMVISILKLNYSHKVSQLTSSRQTSSLHFSTGHSYLHPQNSLYPRPQIKLLALWVVQLCLFHKAKSILLLILHKHFMEAAPPQSYWRKEQRAGLLGIPGMRIICILFNPLERMSQKSKKN